MPERSGASSDPHAMRAAMANFVTALHKSYLSAAAVLPAGDRARLPLVAAEHLTVIAVGTRHLHVIGTAEAMPAPVSPEVVQDGSVDGFCWTLRFMDPVVLPALGLIDESNGPNHIEVRRLLGLRSNLYHLAVPPGGSLTPHHAMHAGTGLAHAHAAVARDFDAIRAHSRAHPDLIEEARSAATMGLPRALALVAAAVVPGDRTLVDLALRASAGEPVDPVAVRKALLAAVRALEPATGPGTGAVVLPDNTAVMR